MPVTFDDHAVWTAHCDGCAAPNPGPMGLGMLLRSPDGEQVARSIQAPGRGCNNEAELRAVLLALQSALLAGASRLVLYTDSRIVADHLACRSRCAVKPPSIPIRLQALVDEIRKEAADLQAFVVTWIPRHRNALADALSRAAVGLAPKNDRGHSRR